MFLSFFKNITLLITCVVLFSFGGYANGDDLKNTDPNQPLEASISSCIKDVQEKLWMAQSEFEQEERKFEDYSFEGCFLGGADAPSPRQIDHLAHDQKSLERAKDTLDWIAQITNMVRKKLKTNAARKT